MIEKQLDCNKYLTQQINEKDIKTWNSKKVILDCPTGMGKTTLINKVVAKVAGNENALVLFLSSRTSLSEQQKENLKKLGVENVQVITYQYLESILNRKGDFDASRYAFIVCDEAHYFTNDAIFNDNTAISYKWIEAQPTVVYMSATGYTVFKYMNDRQVVDINYYTSGDYSKVSTITFCHSDEHMIECIEDIYNSGEKGIIFMDKMVRDGELGTRVHTPIMQWYLEHQDEAHFMCSKSRKDYKSINEIETAIVDGEFEKQLLFCTQALEVGIDVTDTKCKHVMVELFDYDSVIQALGRIRNKDGIHYYIRVYDKRTLSGKAQTIKNNFIDKAKDFEALNWEDRWDYCMKGRRFDSNKGLFFVDIFDDKRIKVNELMLYKYKDIYAQYMACIIGVKEGYEQLSKHAHVNRWMHDFNDLNFKGQFIDLAERDEANGTNEIKAYLECLVDIKLDKEQQKELIEKLNIRGKNGELRKTVKPINAWLMENGFNYMIVNKKVSVNGNKFNAWIVTVCK